MELSSSVPLPASSMAVAHSGVEDDVAIVVVSTNEVGWLEACLSSVFDHAGSIRLDVVVVDNASTDDTHEFVEAAFPRARVVTCENHGFAHANNRGALTCNARYMLFLNPDTRLVDGTLGELVATMDAQTSIGLAGVRQITADGTLWPTIRYFPSITRALGDAIGFERWRRRPHWAGERELDLSLYDKATECDWTSGSFMLARREALLSAGLLDERFFLQSEEPDLCRRMKQAGWGVWHLPAMTIIHHARKAGVVPEMVAQSAYARRQYASKYFSRPYATAFLAVSCVNQLSRAVASFLRSDPGQRGAARLALRALIGLDGSPYESPPQTALRP